MQYIIDKKKCIDYNMQYQDGERGIMKNLKMKSARVGKDLSQEDLAKRVGVTRQTIGMIEAGKFNPSLQLCIAICRALDKTLDEIFWEEDVQ